MSQIQTRGVSREALERITLSERGIQLKTLADMAEWATTWHASGLAPRSLDSPQKIMIAMDFGMRLGLSCAQAIRAVYVVNGIPSLWGDALPALAYASGKITDWREWYERGGVALNGSEEDAALDDTWCAVCELHRVGLPTPIVRRFSMRDAATANLLKKQGPWQSHPKRMLRMRARAFAFRDGLADVLGGLAIAEEAEDYTVFAQPIQPPRPKALAAPVQDVPTGGPDAAPPADSGNVPPAATDAAPPLISDDQRRRLFAIAREHGVSVDEVKAYLRETFQIESTLDITKSLYPSVCQWLETPRS